MGYHVNFLGSAPDLGPRDLSQRLGNGRAIHLGGFSGPGDHSGHISDHFRRFRARQPICDLNVVILPQLRALRLEHCVLTQDRCLFLQQKRLLLLRQDRCLLLRRDRCLLLQEQTSVTTHIVDVSEVSTIPILMSQKSQLWQCHNVQVADRRSGPKSTKMTRNGSRMVARA